MDQKPIQFQTLLFTLAKKAKGDMEQELTKSKSGLTFLQFAVLKDLNRKNTTIHEIAEHLSIKPPSLVPVVDQLEAKKLLERQPDENDRRKIQLSLTLKGQKTLKKVPFQNGSRLLQQAFEKMEAPKQVLLIELLQQLITHFS